MKDNLLEAIAQIKKLADYGDIRMKDIATEFIKMENGQISNLSRGRSRGVGIRVYVDGAMGFAATSDMDKLTETVQLAYDTALASATLLRDKAVLSPKEAAQAEYSTPISIDPFSVALQDKIDVLMACHSAGANEAHMDFRREDVIFADTDGSYIVQKFYQSGGGVVAWQSERCSFDNYLRAGYEAVVDLKLAERAKMVAEEARVLSEAEDCPAGLFDMILMPTQLQLQIHESVGHPTELDRVLGSEAAFAGASFLSPTDSGLKYGSEHVTIVADASTNLGLGTFAYDDEGVPAQNVTLIDRGTFRNFQSSRDNSPNSHGMGLSDGWQNLPIVRMTNINLQSGNFTLDELISDIEYGFLLENNKSWSIDDKRINFQFACEIAREIKDGKLSGKLYKNPTYTGRTTEFWGSCDGVANESHREIIGVPNCGKGQPMQVIRCSHASSPARFRKVRFING